MGIYGAVVIGEGFIPFIYIFLRNLVPAENVPGGVNYYSY